MVFSIQPYLEIKGGPVIQTLERGVGNGLQKNFFRPFRPHQFGLKIREGPGPSEAPPLDPSLSDIQTTVTVVIFFVFSL